MGTNKIANDYIEISNVEECVYQELDYPITEKEVQAVIATLKKKKSTGKDNLLNEYFITFKDVFVPLLVRLFNVIFDSGNLPSIWTEGIIIPLFKKVMLMMQIIIEELPLLLALKRYLRQL